VRGIVQRKKLQRLEKLITTDNKEGKPQINPTEFFKNKEVITKAICEDETTLKAVKNAYLRGGMEKPLDEDPKKTQEEKDVINAGAKKQNGESVAITFSAYLVAGSKDHFYNVIVENDFKGLNKKTKEIEKGMDNSKNIADIQKDLKTKKEEEDKAEKDSKNTKQADGKTDKTDDEKKADQEKLKKAQEDYDKASFASLGKIFSGKDEDNKDPNSAFNMLKSKLNTEVGADIINRRTLKAYLE